MRSYIRAGAMALALTTAIAGASSLGGCSDAQVAATNATLDKYDHALDNFTAIAARVDQSVAKTDATVGPYCSSAEQTGQNLGQIIKGNDRAYTALNTVTAALSSWCTSAPKDAAAAVVALTKAIAAGQVVLQGGG